mgnify:CR=1 FL=1
MIEAIKLIKANFKMSLMEFILGSIGFAVFIFLMTVLILLGGSLI